MEFKVDGLEELARKMDNLARSVEQLSGPHHVPIGELLTPSFLACCSRFSSVDQMFQTSGFKIDTNEDLESIPESDWDTFIKTNTSFESWRQMLEAAGADWTKRQLALE
jgi:hypothetical protein